MAENSLSSSRPRLHPLRRLLPYVLRHKRTAALAALFLLLAAGATLALPPALKQMIDGGFLEGDPREAAASFGGLFALAGLMAFGSAGRFYFVLMLGERVVADLRRDVFAHLTRLSPAFFDRSHSSEIAARLSADTVQIKSVVGATASLAAYRGRPVVLTFLYSTCEDTCPTQVQAIRGALDDLGADVPVLAISVDPANDTPQRARRFVLAQRMTGRMRFLLGGRAELAPLWKAYAIAPQRDELEHSAYVLLIDAQGRQRIAFPFGGLTSEGLAHDLRRLAAEPG